MDHTMVKPLLLKADAMQMLGKVEEARDIYKTVLDLEPDCEHAKEGVKVCEEMIGRYIEGNNVIAVTIASGF